MDLSKIIYIPGKPGLYKIIGNNKTAFIVESLIDSKRLPVFMNSRMSPLSDIVVVTKEDQVHVEVVFKNTLKEFDGKIINIDQNDEDSLISFMDKVLPDWDKDAVTPKDIKKLIQWYNLLIDKSIISLEDLKEDSVESQESEVKDDSIADETQKEKSEISENEDQKQSDKTDEKEINE
ncbi:MAG: DUF5606 domain-containing protein [Bacteroidales bacterium]|nr:DUF5606 domain-containing protein [Bacteroidales bacterium]